MTFAAGLLDQQIHDAALMRRADADLLSLAFMDARNRTLRWLAAFEGVKFEGVLRSFDPPWWLAGQAAWFQEYWIARHLQRSRGAGADPGSLRLASIEPHADDWFDPNGSASMQRWLMQGPDEASLHAYMAATLDTTLELLEKAEGDETALHSFRQALAHEDLLGERLAELIQALDLPADRQAGLVECGLWPELSSRQRRDAVGLPGQRWLLGSEPGAWVPPAEQWAHPVQLFEFEIDAQPVCWDQFTEFIDDGGYDDRQWWTDDGWDWLEVTERRAPRYVEQMSGAVMARRQGRLQRLPAGQAVVHVSAHEADAWCRWAGRRLPSEAEWEAAACQASARGFAWGQVLEWVAGRPRAYPDAPAASQDQIKALGADARVLRGASAWGSARLKHARARRFESASRDSLFAGFRTCAL